MVDVEKNQYLLKKALLVLHSPDKSKKNNIALQTNPNSNFDLIFYYSDAGYYFEILNNSITNNLPKLNFCRSALENRHIKSEIKNTHIVISSLTFFVEEILSASFSLHISTNKGMFSLNLNNPSYWIISERFQSSLQYEEIIHLGYLLSIYDHQLNFVFVRDGLNNLSINNPTFTDIKPFLLSAKEYGVEVFWIDINYNKRKEIEIDSSLPLEYINYGDLESLSLNNSNIIYI